MFVSTKPVQDRELRAARESVQKGLSRILRQPFLEEADALFGLLFHIVGRDEDHKAERNGNDTGDDLQLIPAAGEAQNQGEGVEDQADQGDKSGPLILDASLAATRSR